MTYPERGKTRPMQIIINEVEIKQAITDYVLGQMSINDDQDIAIDLRATRGDTGYTAEIIVSNKVPEPEPVALDLSGKINDAKRRGRPPKAAVEAVQEAAVEQKEEPALDPADKPVEVAEAAPVAVVDPEPEVEAEGVPDAPAPADRPTGSIFGNLTKPVNTKPE